ncbi:hypothetical protein BE21_53395 [Sorangium cellulosum]|uniref:Disintegrin domain-containing protein n=1 Tax=Sorangium cellulosum TaxID=56 RepID=A0A150TES3_SORCE|nr:hypothetical protein BE21_53395 [Sorangium cellulosum]
MGEAPGTCVCKQPLGAACTNAEECVSNLCVDGYCCNSNCGQCEACDVPGLAGFCTTIGTMESPEAPRPGREPCGGEQECEGRCKGLYSDRCSYELAGTPCGEASCENEIAISYACTADHACAQSGESRCRGFKCAEDACLERCSSREEHCIEAAVCVDGECVEISVATCDGDQRRLISPDGTVEDCGAYRCKEGAHACANPCNDFTDCADDLVCNHAGECVPALVEPTEFSSCNASRQTGRNERWLWALVALALSARLGGRRARAGTSSAERRLQRRNVQDRRALRAQ